MQDEEINALLATVSDPLRAAVFCAETIGGLYARRVSEGSRQAEVLLRHYQQLAVRLRRQMAMGVSPFVGGQSIAAKDAQNQNTDRVQPAFTIGEFTEPSTENMVPGLLPQQSAY